MTTLSITNFHGVLPIADEEKLPPGYAVEAVNCDFSSGALRGLKSEGSSSYTSKDVFFYDADTTLTFSEDVDVHRSPQPSDSYKRVYWSGEGKPLQVTPVTGTATQAVTAAASTNTATFKLGVPRPGEAPFITAYNPIGHLVAHAEMYVANEREGGAFTEVTSLPNFAVWGSSYMSLTSATKSAATGSNSSPGTYALAKAGPNTVNNILRSSYLWYRINETSNNNSNTKYEGTGSKGNLPYGYGVPQLRGKAYVGGVIETEEYTVGADTKVRPKRTADKLPVMHDYGTPVDLYYADDQSTFYIKVPPEIATGDFIRGVVNPFVHAYAKDEPDSWALEDIETGETKKFETTCTFTFKRCTSRDTANISKSTWYYYTNRYTTNKFPNDNPFVAVAPVIANDTDGPGGLPSLGPVIIMDAWLAAYDAINTNKLGSITGRTYTSQSDDPVLVDSEYYESLDDTGKANVKAKLAKVRCVFRLNGDHTMPEALADVEPLFTITNYGNLLNNVVQSVTFNLTMNIVTEKVEARSCVYTYVNEFGEESAPSDPLEVPSWPRDAYMRLMLKLHKWSEGFYAPVTKVRLYTAATGSQGTDFLFSNEFVIVEALTATYSDPDNKGVLYTGPTSVSPSGTSTAGYTTAATTTTTTLYLKVTDNCKETELGEALSTQRYGTPVGNLRGLTVGHNGMFAAFSGKDVWISEPYLPYAWDASAIQTLPDEVTGIAAIENYFVVTTRKYSYILSGNTPQTITNQQIPGLYPGVNKKSILVHDGSVLYASMDGIVRIQGGQADTSMSTQFFGITEWKNLFDPATVGLALHDSHLLIYGTKGTTAVAYLCNLAQGNKGVTKYSVGAAITNTSYNPFADELILFRGTSASKLFGGAARLDFTYKTPPLEVPDPTCMAALQILGSGTVTPTITVYPETVSSFNASVDYSPGEMALATNHTLRLPAGVPSGVTTTTSFKSRKFSIKLEGAAGAVVKKVNLSASMQGLRRV